MSKSVFVNHKFEDGPYKDKLARWAAEGLLGDVTITGETEDVRQHGAAAIKAHLGDRIRGAGVLLVLVGADSHNRPWVDYEVQFAQSHRVRVVVVRIPGTRGAAPPAVRQFPEVAFEPSAIARAIR